MAFMSLRSLPTPDNLKMKVYTILVTFVALLLIFVIWWPHDPCWAPKRSPFQRISLLNRERWITWLRRHTDSMGSLLQDGLTSYSLVLYAAIYLTEGPIIELGASEFSTNLLDRISEETSRRVLSADHNQEWLMKFESDAKADCHHFEYVDVDDDEVGDGANWGRVGNDGTKWSVAFVDQKPAMRRREDVLRLIEYSEIVIAHDSEDNSENLYHFKEVLSNAHYLFRWEKLDAQTTAVSNSRPDVIDSIELLVKWTEEELESQQTK